MKIQPLNQSKFKAKIVKDLGMVTKTKRPERHAIFECTSCSTHYEKATPNEQRSTTGLCPICATALANSKKVKVLTQKNFSMKLIKFLGRVKPGNRNSYAVLKCPTCKEQSTVPTSTLNRKRVQCASCDNPDRGTDHQLYSIWNGIKQRCYAHIRKDYNRYGAQGVTMCDEWVNNPKTFIDFCVTNGWKPGLQVDKDIKCKELGIHPAIYAPHTVTFVTPKENAEEANGKLIAKYTLDGVLIATYSSAAEAARQLGGKNRHAISNAANGVSKSSYGFKWKYV